MLSAVGGESKNKPVDLATSPPSSDQDKSSWVNGPKCPDPTIQDTGRKILLEPHGENILSCSTSGGQLNEALLKRTEAALSAICLAPFTFTEGNIINYEATNKKDLITSLNEAGNGAHFKDKGFIFSFNACDLNNRDGMLRIAGTLTNAPTSTLTPSLNFVSPWIKLCNNSPIMTYQSRSRNSLTR